MSGEIRLSDARIADTGAVMRVMEAAFDPAYGEAWSTAQLATLFALSTARVCLAWDGEVPCGFSAARIAGPESELLLLAVDRSEEHTSELQSLMRISYAVFCLKKKNSKRQTHEIRYNHNNKIQDAINNT